MIRKPETAQTAPQTARPAAQAAALPQKERPNLDLEDFTRQIPGEAAPLRLTGLHTQDEKTIEGTIIKRGIVVRRREIVAEGNKKAHFCR